MLNDGGGGSFDLIRFNVPNGGWKGAIFGLFLLIFFPDGGVNYCVVSFNVPSMNGPTMAGEVSVDLIRFNVPHGVDRRYIWTLFGECFFFPDGGGNYCVVRFNVPSMKGPTMASFFSLDLIRFNVPP